MVAEGGEVLEDENLYLQRLDSLTASNRALKKRIVDLEENRKHLRKENVKLLDRNNVLIGEANSLEKRLNRKDPTNSPLALEDSPSLLHNKSISMEKPPPGEALEGSQDRWMPPKNVQNASPLEETPPPRGALEGSQTNWGHFLGSPGKTFSPK